MANWEEKIESLNKLEGIVSQMNDPLGVYCIFKTVLMIKDKMNKVNSIFYGNLRCDNDVVYIKRNEGMNEEALKYFENFEETYNWMEEQYIAQMEEWIKNIKKPGREISDKKDIEESIKKKSQFHVMEYLVRYSNEIDSMWELYNVLKIKREDEPIEEKEVLRNYLYDLLNSMNDAVYTETNKAYA